MRSCECGTILASDNPGPHCGACALGRWEHPYFEGFDRLKGPELAEWLVTLIPPCTTNDEGWISTLQRAIHRWRTPGSIVGFDVVDRYLVKLGFAPTDVPEHIWTDVKRQKREWPKETKREVLEAYARGVTPKVLSQTYGVATDTIHKWRRDAGLPMQQPGKAKVAA